MRPAIPTLTAEQLQSETGGTVTPVDVLNAYPNDATTESQLNTQIVGSTIPQGYEEDYTNAIIGAFNQQTQPVQPDPYTQSLLNAYNSQFTPAEIGPQGQAALYPGLGHNINVGTYGGSIVGSNPIFVPGGNIMAIDPMLARRKAIDDAARARAMSIKPFEPAVPYKLKEARFQEKFNQSFYNASNRMIDEAKKKYGKDFGIVLGDENTPEGRKYIQTMANYEVLGRNHDQIVDLIANIDKGLQDKTIEYTPETLKLYNEFKTLTGNFENGDIFASGDLQSMYDKLQGHRSFEDYIQKDNFLKDFSGQVAQYLGVKDMDEYYKVATTETVKFDQSIDEAVESLASTVFAPEIAQGLYTKEYMKKAIRARLKDQIKQQGTITKKDQENISGVKIAEEGIKYGKDKPAKLNIFDYSDSGEILPTKTDYNSYYAHDINTANIGTKKAIRITGATVINQGKPQTLEGEQQVQLNSLETVQWTGKDGKLNTNVVAITKVEAPVKRAYKKNFETGKWDPISTNEYYRDKDKEGSEPNDYQLREETQIVDKPMVLDEGTFNEVRNQLQTDQDRENFTKAYREALKRKKELQGVDEYGVPTE